MEVFEKIVEKLKNSGHSSDFYDLAQCYEAINQFGNPNPYYNNFRRLYWYFKAGQSGYADAYNNIGFIIEHEMKIKNQQNRAKEYYKKAYLMGSQLGKENYLLSLNQNQ